jgi:NadR type nicotinamide-nucleotide adenylyltransferase
MERELNKRNFKTGKVVITGPESTGKTVLAMQLSDVFGGKYIPEYARNYVSSLKAPYKYQDVINIALEQIRQMDEVNNCKDRIVFFDTWLVITKIWLREVYGTFPEWIDEKLAAVPIDLYLLCAPDIPWEADPVRENGGERRIYLFNEYEKEIKRSGMPFKVITGTGRERFELAERYINEYFKLT